MRLRGLLLGVPANARPSPLLPFLLVFMRLLLLLALRWSSVRAHMSMWDPGMLAFKGPEGCVEDECDAFPVAPLGPGWQKDDWWFRGPKYRSLLPSPSDAAELPAGGKFSTEITCHRALSSYGRATSTAPPTPGTGELDACTNSPGPFHADHDAKIVNDSLISGCALGIADTTKLEEVTMDNIVIFSVQPACVKTRVTEFDIPADMPPCTGDYCICSWYWQPITGIGNFYMTGFYCKVTGSKSTKKLAKPKDPVGCKDDSSKCVKGAKKPLWVYNEPHNVEMVDGDNRPAYGPNWSFSVMGAQNDIFEGSDTSTGEASSSSGSAPESSSSAAAAQPSKGGHESSKGEQKPSVMISEAHATSSPLATTTESPADSNSVTISFGNISQPVLISLVVATLLVVLFVAIACLRQRRASPAISGGTEEKGLRSSDESSSDSESDGGRSRRTR